MSSLNVWETDNVVVISSTSIEEIVDKSEDYIVNQGYKPAGGINNLQSRFTWTLWK